MADRTLIWHHEGTITGSETRIGPAYYLDQDYAALAVRIDAETAPSLDDAEFDIQADGVSIFANQTPTRISPAGRLSYVTSTTSAQLPKGDNHEVDAEDFKNELVLEAGLWITCVPKKGGKGKNFTIALELEALGDGDTEETEE